MIKLSGFGARIGYARNSYSDLRCTLQQKKFEAPASPCHTSQTLNRGAEENRAVIVLRQIDASRLGPSVQR